jgi:hypothetical protein
MSPATNKLSTLEAVKSFSASITQLAPCFQEFSHTDPIAQT